MKVISEVKDEKGNIEIVCKDYYLFGLYSTKHIYRATEENPKGYWDWRCADNVLLDDDEESLEIDYQYRIYLSENNQRNND